MFDTVKGGDYLVDQDAAEVLAREAIETVIELEHMGLPFNRTPDGQDRPAPVRRPHPQLRRGPGPPVVLRGRPDRAHDPADALPAVHQARRRSSTTSTTWSTCCRGRRPGVGGRAAGVVAYRIADGELHRLPRQGGDARHGRLRPDVPDHLERLLLTGDGVALAYRHGVPMRGHGVLPVPPDRASSGIGHPAVGGGARRGRLPAQRRRRAVHGALRADADGARAARHGQPRDRTRRSAAGRGIDGKDYVYLDLRHLGRKVIDEKLPDITDFARVYQGVEPITEPVPIQPTAHYAMGGIPTDLDARVTRDATGTVVPGLYAAGEARLRQRPRREPAGHQLARRPARVRPARRARRWPRTCRASACPTSPTTPRSRCAAELEALRAPTERRERRPRSAASSPT